MEHLPLVLLATALAPALGGWWARGRLSPVLAALVLLLLGGAAAIVASGEAPATPSDGREALTVALAAVLATIGGGPLTTSVFALVDGRDPGKGSVHRAGEVLRGGAWIGALERAAVFAAVCAGWPEGAAVTLALKGLGRYAELRGDTPGAAERFIIGTFTSVLFAVACAGVAHLVAS